MSYGALNARQEAFCREYLKDHNATRAYETQYKARGRVAEANSSRLLSKAKVREFIAELEAKAAKRNDLTVDAVLKGIKNVAVISVKPIPVFDKDGKQIGERCADAAAANKSFEMLGKHLGMFVDKHEVDLNMDLSTLSDEELVALAKRLKAG